MAVDTSVAAASCNKDLREPSFAQDALAQPFEAGGWQFEEYVHDSTSVALGRRPGPLGNDLLGWLRLRGLRAALFLKNADPLEEDLVGLRIRQGG